MNEKNPHAVWTKELFDIFSDAGITLYPFIPDAGNKGLIELAELANETKTVLLTSEEEGVAVCAGAELVGKKVYFVCNRRVLAIFLIFCPSLRVDVFLF